MVLQAAQLRRNEAAKHTPPQRWTTMVAMYNNDMEGAHGRPSDEDVPEHDVPPSAHVAEDEGPAKSGGHGAAMARAEEEVSKQNELDEDLRNPADEDSTSHTGTTGSSEGDGTRNSASGDAAGSVEGAAAKGASEEAAAISEAEPQPGHPSDDSASDDTLRGAEDGAAKGNDGEENKENVDSTLKETDEESDTEDSEDEDAARDDEGVEWLLKIDDLELYKKAMIPEHFYLRISSPKVLTEEQLRLALDRLLGELKWLRLGLKHRQGDCWICYLPKATMQVRICNDDSLGYIMEEPQRSHYYLHNDLLCTVHILADPQVPRTSRDRRRDKKAKNNSADKGDSASLDDRNLTRDYKYLLLLAGPPPLLNEASGRLISDTFVKHLNDAIEESVAQEPVVQSPGSSTGSGADANLDSPSVAQNPSGVDTLNNAGGFTASGISSENGSSIVSAASGVSADKGSSEVSVSTPGVSTASGISSDKDSSGMSASTPEVSAVSGVSSDKGSSEISVSTGVSTASGIASEKGSSEVSVSTVAERPKDGVSNTEASSAIGEGSADADSKQDKNSPSDTEVCSGTDSVNVSLDTGSAMDACSNNGDKKEISLDEIQHIKTFLSEFQKDVNNDDLRFGGENGEENEDDDSYGGVRKSLDSYVNKCFINKCKAERVSYFNAFVACVNAAAVKLLVDAGLESDREVILFHKVNVRFPWPRQEWWTDRDDDGNDADGDEEDDEDDYTSSGQERSVVKVSTVPSSWQTFFWKTAQTVNSKQWEAAEAEKPEMPRKIRPPNEEEVGEQDEGPCVADIHLSVPNITETFEFSAQRQLFKITTIRKLTFVHQFLMTFNINLYIDTESGNLGFYLNHSTVFNSRAIKIRFAELILAVLKRSLQL